MPSQLSHRFSFTPKWERSRSQHPIYIFACDSASFTKFTSQSLILCFPISRHQNTYNLICESTYIHKRAFQFVTKRHVILLRLQKPLHSFAYDHVEHFGCVSSIWSSIQAIIITGRTVAEASKRLSGCIESWSNSYVKWTSLHACVVHAQLIHFFALYQKF